MLPSPLSNSRKFHHARKELHLHYCHPLPNLLTTRNPLSTFLHVPVLDVSCPWNPTPCVVCLLLSLSIVSRSVHMVASVGSFVFFSLSDALCEGDTSVCCRTFGLCPCFGHCEHVHAAFRGSLFSPLGHAPRRGM